MKGREERKKEKEKEKKGMAILFFKGQTIYLML